MMDMPMLLGVNIDHFATIRNARLAPYPSIADVAKLACKAGADRITVHVREDMRHVKDTDLEPITQNISVGLNLEMGCNKQMLDLALKHHPYSICLVPEHRQELTTEGGLDMNNAQVLKFIETLKSACPKSIITLFLEPTKEAIQAAKDARVHCVELHTGKYSILHEKCYKFHDKTRAFLHKITQEQKSYNYDQLLDTAKCSNSQNFDQNLQLLKEELERIKAVSQFGKQQGIRVNAGHGLNLLNVTPISKIDTISELNIGHALVAESAIHGIEKAIGAMLIAMEISCGTGQGK